MFVGRSCREQSWSAQSFAALPVRRSSRPAQSVSSCQQYSADTPAPQPQVIEVIVRNDGFLDANVYAALPNGARGARLGMVTGYSTGRLACV